MMRMAGAMARALALPSANATPLQLAASRGFAASAPGEGIIEVREYTLKPEGMVQYLKLSADSAPVRKALLPFLGMFTCDVGGGLNRVVHFYHYKDFDQRDAMRAAAAKDPRWSAFVAESRKHVAAQESKIMLESKPIYAALGIPATADFKGTAPAGGGTAMYELRSYQLHPGYGSVPKLYEAFGKGLPDKIKSDPEGSLVFFGHTDVGTLNNVVELWRYPSAQACIRARQAARTVPTWRETIGNVTPGVQHFTSSFMKPCAFSPWQ